MNSLDNCLNCHRRIYVNKVQSLLLSSLENKIFCVRVYRLTDGGVSSSRALNSTWWDGTLDLRPLVNLATLLTFGVGHSLKEFDASIFLILIFINWYSGLSSSLY